MRYFFAAIVCLALICSCAPGKKLGKKLKINEKETKNLVSRIEKDRSYIRRFNVEKKEVKKLVIRLEGAQ
jgi:hypothetical protein